MEQGKIGYSTTTYRLRLYQKHREWLKMTKDIYNEVVKYYYDILLLEDELWDLTNQQMMRKLELMTIGARYQKEEVKYPFPYGKIPLYFRRTAIHAAIGAGKSFIFRWKLYKEGKIEEIPKKAKEFHASPVFYVGMYRNRTENSIQLKVYNGVKWVWDTYRFHDMGRKLPEDCQMKSPSLKVTKKGTWLHVPVVTPVEDIRTVNERMKEEQEICAVYFPNNNNLAVCARMDLVGNVREYYLIKGGNKRKNIQKKWQQQLKKSRKSRQPEKRRENIKEEKKQEGKENQKYYKKISQLNEHYAHKVSREILNYCMEREIRLIVVPKYENVISFQDKGYLKTDGYDWIGRRIIRDLKYKSYQNGIVTTTIRPYHISDTCHICDGKIKRYNQGHRASKNYYGGQLYICENGHRGNAAKNSAENIGRYFLKHYQKEKDKV